MTRRLYYEDWACLEFTGLVQSCETVDDKAHVILEQSAFYPTGGGQPHDTGRLDRIPVVDVWANDAGEVVHVLDGAVDLEAGREVTGQVDPARRQDHTQQHTAQHILSQAFVQTCGRETLSFHLGEDASSIDLDGLIGPQQARQAEDLVNRILWEDRPVHVHTVGPDELDRFPIRKVTFTGPTVRLIEVTDFDVSTCGGTHVHRTGEIGVLLLTRLEKIRGGSRVVFTAGGRSLSQARQDRQVVQEVTQTLSTSADRVAAQVTQLRADHRQQGRRLKVLAETLAESEARELAQGPAPVVLVRDLDGRTWEEVQALAQALSRHAGVVALLGLKTEGRLLLVRGEDRDLHAGQTMKRALEGLEGGGGGSANRAQAQLGAEEWSVAFERLTQAVQH